MPEVPVAARCYGCEEPFLYNLAARKWSESIVEDSKRRYWHERCWVDPQYEEKHHEVPDAG